MIDNQIPTVAIIPHLGQCRGLGRNADIGFRNLPRQILWQAWGRFLCVNAQDIAGCVMESDLPEIVRLMVGISLEEQANPIGSIGLFCFAFGGGGEFYRRILLLVKLFEIFSHGAFQTTVMLLLEFFCVGEPADDIAQCAYGELYQYRFVLQVQQMVEYRLVQIFLSQTRRRKGTKYFLLLMAQPSCASQAKRILPESSSSICTCQSPFGSFIRAPSLKSKRMPFGPFCVGSAGGGIKNGSGAGASRGSVSSGAAVADGFISSFFNRKPPYSKMDLIG